MNGKALYIKRSNSDSLHIQSNIISPSPIRRASKLGLNVAKEICDLSSSLEDFDSHSLSSNIPSLKGQKYYSLRLETDSLNEWGSESSTSNSIQGDYESPMKGSERSYLVTDSYDEICSEIPRSGNPLVHDATFMRRNEEPFRFNLTEAFMTRA